MLTAQLSAQVCAPDVLLREQLCMHRDMQPDNPRSPCFSVHSPVCDSMAEAQAGAPVVLLREQYRMHPAIAAWPSAYFYDGQLVTPPATHEEYSAAFHALAAFPPLAFYDCRSADLAHFLPTPLSAWFYRWKLVCSYSTATYGFGEPSKAHAIERLDPRVCDNSIIA